MEQPLLYNFTTQLGLCFVLGLACGFSMKSLYMENAVSYYQQQSYQEQFNINIYISY